MTTKETNAGAAAAENPLKGVRVLAVDDEVDILETIEDVLDGAGVRFLRRHDPVLLP